MATLTKTTTGYRAQIYVKGVREAKTFRTQREAKAWADARVTEVREDTAKTPKEKHTLSDAMARYAVEKSPKKRGHLKELIRLKALERHEAFPTQVLMSKLTPDLFAKWRDARLKEVEAGSILREISLISDLLETAKIEWQWIDSNPIRDIRKPRRPDHRDTVISPREVRIMLKTMSYSPRSPIRSVAQAVAVCFLTAMRTGMRAGELTGLTWDLMFDDYCHLPITKTKKRDVPLTHKAIRLIRRMEGYDSKLVFGMKPQSLDANFRKYRERAELSGFTFHDTRHTAATMLAHKVDVLTLCKIFGWTNTSQALTYYNPTASSIAGLLNR